MAKLQNISNQFDYKCSFHFIEHAEIPFMDEQILKHLQ